MKKIFNYSNLFEEKIAYDKDHEVLISKCVIPKIQRAYAQGRKEEGYVRTNLLEEIFSSLYDCREMDLNFVYGAVHKQDEPDKYTFEVIDGQQRLTTIYLLYKYLLDQKGWNAETLKDEEDGKELYHIFYATRDGSAKFLESMSMKMIKESGEDEFKKNVDFFHMANAFKYIAEWIKTDGKAINIRYQLGGSLDNIRNSFFKLLNGMSNTKGGSVQVLWYEIAESKEKNNIKEFQKINTGKIRLTDAELIKGLFYLNTTIPINSECSGNMATALATTSGSNKSGSNAHYG